jgi:TM2 domain-containing membrane protein YozV
MSVMTTGGATYLKYKNPLMVVWWSAAFPGFGHLFLNQYIRGVLLTLAEVILNTLAHINQSLMYSFSGRFQLAKNTLEIRWAVAYMLIYMLTVWDSYLNARSLNKLYRLASLENAKISSGGVFKREIQFLDRRSRAAAAFVSLFFPGMGQLYNQRVGLAFYGMFWWGIYSYFSYAPVAIHHLLTGDLAGSTSVLRCHWLLFMPSVAGGAAYHAFETAGERNYLLRVEQRQYLQERYGDTDIRILQR